MIHTGISQIESLDIDFARCLGVKVRVEVEG